MTEQTIRQMQELIDGSMGDAAPYCKAACPMHTDVRGYVNRIAEGRFAEAIKLIREKLFLPATLGRICAHPCEAGHRNRGGETADGCDYRQWSCRSSGCVRSAQEGLSGDDHRPTPGRRLDGRDVTLSCLEGDAVGMLAHDWEVAEALEEGVTMHQGWGLVSINPGDNGSVASVTLKRCVSVFDAGGTFAPTFDDNEQKTIDVDSVVFAIGRKVNGPGLESLPRNEDVPRGLPEPAREARDFR